MAYNIETIKKFKTDEIVELIKNNMVADEVIDVIVFEEKQKEKALNNPKIYKAILFTMPEEDIAINILEKLIAKNQAEIADFINFLSNIRIKEDKFNAYILDLASFFGKSFLKEIEQADPRINERFLNLIVKEELEKADILLNKNLNRENFVKVAKKHIKEENYQKNISLFNLNKYDISLAVELARNCDNDFVLLNVLRNTFITKAQAEELREIIPQSLLMRALSEGFFASGVAEVIFEKVKDYDLISQRTFAEIFYNYPNLIEKAGYKNIDEFFKSVKNKETFTYVSIKVSRKLQEELLNEFKEFNIKDNESVYYLRNIGIYLAKTADLDIAREIVKRNNKMFEAINLSFLSRDDVIVTKEDIKDFLSNGTKFLNKIFIIDGVELCYQYNNENILSAFIEKADTKAKEELLKVAKDCYFNSFFTTYPVYNRKQILLKQLNAPEKVFEGVGADEVALNREERLNEEQLKKLIENYFNKNINARERSFKRLLMNADLSIEDYTEQTKEKLILIAIKENVKLLIPFFF